MNEVPTFRRDDLAQLQGMSPRLLAAFEHQATAVQEASNGIADTQALKDATVIVLSANGDFTNERVLVLGDGIDAEITDTTVRLKVKDVARTSDFGVTLIPPAEVTLFLPVDGTLVSAEAPALLENKVLSAPELDSIPDFANDAAAAAGGVPVTRMYRNGSILMVRVA